MISGFFGCSQNTLNNEKSQQGQFSDKQKTQDKVESNSINKQSQLAENKEVFIKKAININELDFRMLYSLAGMKVYLSKDSKLYVCKANKECSLLNLSLDKIDQVELFEKDLILAVSYQRSLRLINLKSERIIASKDFREHISTLTFSNNLNSVFVGCITGNVYHWYYKKEKKEELDIFADLTRYSGHTAIVQNIAVHPSDRVFFSTDIYGVLSAWLTFESQPYDYKKIDNPFYPEFWSEVTERSKAKLGQSVSNMKVRNDGRYLLLALKDGTLKLWAIRGFKEACSVKLHKGVIKKIDLDESWSKVSTLGRDMKRHSLDLSASNIDQKYCDKLIK